MNFAQTELLIHVVNRETNRILDVDRWVGVCAQPVFRSASLPWKSERGPTKEARMTPSGLLYGGSTPDVGRAGGENTVWVYEQSATPLSLTLSMCEMGVLQQL